jgi:hypothetical protein
VSKKFSGEASAVDIVPEYPTLPLEANIQVRVVLNGVIAANGTLPDVRLVSLPVHSISRANRFQIFQCHKW